jgi:hypothetical protein
VPLGHQLRADDDIGAARRDLLDLAFSARAEPKRSDDSTAIRASGNSAAASSASRSTPGRRGPAGPRPAGRAGVGHRFRLAALVADQPLEEPVLDHARVAVSQPIWCPQARQSVTGA